MRSSHNVWIPSLQHPLRFKDLSFDQYRCVVKVLDENDLELISTLNEIIHENIVSKFDVDRLTTLDRFIIFLSLKINSCGSSIVLSRKCDGDKCEKITNIKMDLNQLVDNIAPNIDKQFTTQLSYQNFGVICDIPTIKTEHEIYMFNNIQNVEFRSFEFNLSNYAFSHITDIFIQGQQINLNKLQHHERLLILNRMPAGLLNQIQTGFLDDIHNTVSDIDFLKMTCQDCKKEFEIKFDISNINDVLKIIYKDESVENLLHTIVNVCSQTYLGGYIGELSPMEVNRINKLVIDSQKKTSAETEQQNKDIDLFSKYRAETEHLQESQSEFAL